MSTVTVAAKAPPAALSWDLAEMIRDEARRLTRPATKGAGLCHWCFAHNEAAPCATCRDIFLLPRELRGAGLRLRRPRRVPVANGDPWDPLPWPPEFMNLVTVIISGRPSCRALRRAG